MSAFVPGLRRATAIRPIPSGISHVIFDFDGTLSWLRNGWPDIMLQLFSEFLPPEQRHSDSFRLEMRREILSLNGKPSVQQIRRFHELAPSFKAAPPEPSALLELYLTRLNLALVDRIGALVRQEVEPESFVIAGAFTLLNELHHRGLRLIILSGTAEPDVRREAEILKLTRYFGTSIYGSIPGTDFSKKDVIDRIMYDEGVLGEHLLSFGDGPVEIEFTKAVGGFAIGVASDEHVNGSGVIDEDKHEHLLRAGADAIIPDYRNTRWIMETFFP